MKAAESWWIIHLHFVVGVNPKSPPGSTAVIGAASNQVGAAYIQLKSTQRNGRDVILWTEDGMINGVVTHVSRGTHLDIRFSNVLPIAGVRPDRNELSFMVGQNGLVRKLTVMPDSSIEHTPLAPAQITLSERLSRAHVSVGEVVRDRVTVRNVGGSAAKRVQVALGPVPAAVSVIGRDQRTLGSLASNRAATASFLLRAGQIGRFPIGVSASCSSNQQVAIQHISVSASPLAHTRTARSKRSSRALIAALTAAIAFFALVALIGGAGMPSVAPWGAGFLAGALAFAFWYLLINARLTSSTVATVASIAVALLLARISARKIRSRGALVLALLGVSALALVLNVAVLFVFFVVANT